MKLTPVLDPTWASINLCALVCIQCSGIHRSLGTHISKVRGFRPFYHISTFTEILLKVRSTTLDKWEFETRQLFKMMTNDKVNQVYEALLPNGAPERITEASSRFVFNLILAHDYRPRVYDNVQGRLM